MVRMTFHPDLVTETTDPILKLVGRDRAPPSRLAGALGVILEKALVAIVTCTLFNASGNLRILVVGAENLVIIRAARCGAGTFTDVGLKVVG